MASGRPSKAYQGGGGFLNNVDGAIVGYKFTDVAPGADKAGELIFLRPEVLVDGAEAPVGTSLLYGNTERYTISKDGKTLVGDSAPNAKLNGSRFIASLVKAGFDENLFPEDVINFEPMVGARCRFEQEIDEQAIERVGNRTYTDKAGKKRESPRTRTVVSKFYGLPEGKGTKTVTKAATKPNGKAIEQSVEEVAAETLLAILNENDGSILKSKLPTKVAVKLGPKHPMRDEVRRTIFSEEFLNSEQGWGYDSKSQTIVSA